MAIVRNNDITKGLSGKFGQMIFKNYGDKTVVCPVPNMSNLVHSKKQLANQDNMKAANEFGKKVIASPQRKAACMKLKGVNSSKAYHAAVQEFYDALRENRPVMF